MDGHQRDPAALSHPGTGSAAADEALPVVQPRGRRVLHTQLAAGLVSALLLSVVNVTIYAIPFLAQGPLALKDCPLGHSVWAVGTPWFDWTYGQYLAILTGMVLALGLGIGAVTLFLSRFSDNYVSMLLKAFRCLWRWADFLPHGQ